MLVLNLGRREEIGRLAFSPVGGMLLASSYRGVHLWRAIADGARAEHRSHDLLALHHHHGEVQLGLDAAHHADDHEPAGVASRREIGRGEGRAGMHQRSTGPARHGECPIRQAESLLYMAKGDTSLLFDTDCIREEVLRERCKHAGSGGLRRA